jgi:hypothetical protein
LQASPDHRIALHQSGAASRARILVVEGGDYLMHTIPSSLSSFVSFPPFAKRMLRIQKPAQTNRKILEGEGVGSRIHVIRNKKAKKRHAIRVATILPAMSCILLSLLLGMIKPVQY